MEFRRTPIGKGHINTIYEFEMPNGDKKVIRECVDFTAQENTIKKWNLVKKAGIKTTSCLEGINDGGRPSLLTDLLDTDKYYYVSPNTPINQNNPKELFLSQNKLVMIMNFEDFVEELKMVAVKAAENLLSLNFDAYFYRIMRNETMMDLDYIIADWECIEPVKQCDWVLKNGNVLWAMDALSMFLDKYLEDGTFKKKYKEIVKREKVNHRIEL